MNTRGRGGPRRRIYSGWRDHANADAELVGVAGQLASALARRFGLTTRQEEIVRLSLEGLRIKEIGKRRGISVNTVKAHLKSVHSRTRTNDHRGLALRAVAALNGGD